MKTGAVSSLTQLRRSQINIRKQSAKILFAISFRATNSLRFSRYKPFGISRVLSKKPDRNQNLPIREENDTDGGTENTIDGEGLIT